MRCHRVGKHVKFLKFPFYPCLCLLCNWHILTPSRFYFIRSTFFSVFFLFFVTYFKTRFLYSSFYFFISHLFSQFLIVFYTLCYWIVFFVCYPCHYFVVGVFHIFKMFPAFRIYFKEDQTSIGHFKLTSDAMIAVQKWFNAPLLNFRSAFINISWFN